jgi:hypothetical protein
MAGPRILFMAKLVALLSVGTIGVHYEISQISKAPIDFFVKLFLLHAIYEKS